MLVRALLGTLILASLPAAAAMPIMVAPFGDRPAQRELFSALELELEVEADLVISDAAVLFEELMVSDLDKVPADEIAAALKRAGQSALVRATFFDEDLYAVIFVLRASDANVVFAKRVEVDLIVADARPELASSLVEVLKDVEVHERIADDELRELGVLPARKAIIAAPPDEEEPEEDPEEKRLADEEPAPTPSSVDRFDAFRIALSWSNQFLLYEACAPLATATPFFCQTRESTVPTEATLVAPRGAALSLEWYPVAWLGMTVDASGFITDVALQADGEDVGVFEPSRFSVQGLSVTPALVMRALYSGDGFGVYSGVRLGYHLETLFAPRHEVVFDDDGEKTEVPVTIVPQVAAHMGVLGMAIGLSFSDAVVLRTDLDFVAGYYDEGPSRIWATRDGVFGTGVFSFGGRGRLAMDVRLPANLILTAGVTAVALNASGAGQGVRRTRDLEAFLNGQARYIRPQLDLGLGARF